MRKDKESKREEDVQGVAGVVLLLVVMFVTVLAKILLTGEL